MSDAATEESARLIELWLRRPQEERTDTGILLFYKWVEENHPELLNAVRVIRISTSRWT